MTKHESVFLDLVRAAILGEKPADPGLTPEDWDDLLRLAERHKLLPLVLDDACGLPSCAAALRELDRQRKAGAEQTEHQPPDARTGWREQALEQFARQLMQENEFLDLMLALRDRGLEALALKGPVCRALYPKPLLRCSVDDDLLIRPEQAADFHAALLELGLTADEPDADPAQAWELSYHKPDSPLYLELHRRLFDPASPVFRDFNRLFDGARDRAVPIAVQDVTLRTLAPTDHLLFLMLHAFKHFLFSGFGVRIICDICLYTQKYRAQIDFGRIGAACAAFRCERFAAALYRIGEKYLGLPAPARFAGLAVDETALLADVLAAGLHGAEIDRLHSANITLGAVAQQKAGKAPRAGLISTLFPSAQKLSGSYPWLQKRPWLLPAAWTARFARYLKERGRFGKENPAASLRIGKERTALLAAYGVIDP